MPSIEFSGPIVQDSIMGTPVLMVTELSLPDTDSKIRLNETGSNEAAIQRSIIVEFGSDHELRIVSSACLELSNTVKKKEDVNCAWFVHELAGLRRESYYGVKSCGWEYERLDELGEEVDFPTSGQINYGRILKLTGSENPADYGVSDGHWFARMPGLEQWDLHVSGRNSPLLLTGKNYIRKRASGENVGKFVATVIVDSEQSF